jgi:hypothetical protein
MSDRPTPLALGTLLMQRGLLTPLQLQHALASQRTSGKFLGAILLEEGMVKPSALLEALSEQFGIPHQSLSLSDVDWRIAKQFPPSFFSDDACFPIRGDDTSVVVAIADPLNAWSLSAMQQATKFRTIRTVLVLEHELKAVCQAYRAQTLRALQQRLR